MQPFCCVTNIMQENVLSRHGKQKTQPVADNRTVDTGDDYAVEYWTAELNTTKTKLLAAVAEVGDAYENVKKQLRKL